MHLISGNTVSNVVLQMYDKILSEGKYVESRNGGCTSIFDTTFEVKNPRSRHLSLIGRKSNIFALIAETFWVLAGDSRVNPYLSFFLPRAPDYSDDTVIWHGSYGPRLYKNNQLSSIVDMFNKDGLYTRRAVCAIHDPALDSREAIERIYGENANCKDLPCNLLMNFYVDETGKFCAKTIQRSGDAIFGAGSINPFEFSFIQELIYNDIKKTNPTLELGAYRWHVTNTHLYDFSISQAVESNDVEENVFNSITEQNHMPIIAPTFKNNICKHFFDDIVYFLTEAIVDDNNPNYQPIPTALSCIFLNYGVPTKDNLLWTYVVLVYNYIVEKVNRNKGDNVKCNNSLLELDLFGHSEEFKRSIMESPFLKFKDQIKV